MKFTVTMKDPDTLDDAITDAVKTLEIDNLDAEELESVKGLRAMKVRDLCRKWFRYGEYLTVEIDTDAETCMVLPAQR